MEGKNIKAKLARGKFKEVFKLKKYYKFLFYSSPLVFGSIGLAVYFYPKFFTWIVYPKLVVLAGTLLVIYTLFAFVSNKFFANKSLWLIQCFFNLLLDIIAIFATGGINSPILFIMLLTLLSSAVSLNYKQVATIGVIIIISVIGFSLLNFSMFADPSYLTKNIVVLIFFCFFVYFIYSLVKETLGQKYQKEEAQIKFIELSEFNQVKETFLTVAAHQLRTPLTGVRWALESLSGDKKMSVQNKQMIKSARERIFTSMDIIDKMLRSVESNSLEFKREMQLVEVDVKELIEKITDNLSYLVNNNRVSLKFNYRATGNIKIKGDPEILHFAFSNVIDNAIRYSPKGQVLITVERDNGFVIIIIKDNGIGIDKTDQQFIFDKFYRAKNAIAINSNQTGVGLYSTKRVISLYGGTITLHSDIGKGTTIVITIPAV